MLPLILWKSWVTPRFLLHTRACCSVLKVFIDDLDITLEDLDLHAWTSACPESLPWNETMPLGLILILGSILGLYACSSEIHLSFLHLKNLTRIAFLQRLLTFSFLHFLGWDKTPKSMSFVSTGFTLWCDLLHNCLRHHYLVTLEDPYSLIVPQLQLYCAPFFSYRSETPLIQHHGRKIRLLGSACSNPASYSRLQLLLLHSTIKQDKQIMIWNREMTHRNQCMKI